MILITLIPKMPYSHRRRNSVSTWVGVSGCGESCPPPQPCKHGKEINVCTSYVEVLILINQINCLSCFSISEESLAYRMLFYLSFVSLTISRLFNIFYTLICQEMSTPSTNFRGICKILERRNNAF